MKNYRFAKATHADKLGAESHAVAPDERNDLKVRDIQAMVRVCCYGRTVGEHIDMIVVHGGPRGTGKAYIVQIAGDDK